MCWLCESKDYDGLSTSEHDYGPVLCRLALKGTKLNVAWCGPKDRPDRVEFDGRWWHKPQWTACPAHYAYWPMKESKDDESSKSTSPADCRSRQHVG